MPEDGGSLPSPRGGSEVPELRDKSRTLPSRLTVSCLAELSEKKRPKVPPPVPKKPSVLLLHTTVQPPTNGSPDGGPPGPTQADSPLGLPSLNGGTCPEDLPDSSPYPFGGDGFPGIPGIPGGVPEREENHVEEENPKRPSLQDPSPPELEEKAPDAEIGPDDVEGHTSPANERTELHITEETDDGVVPLTPTTHTTEDLFTIIHRSKRKLLGRKEPGDSFGSRQNLVSPVKHSAAANSSAGATATASASAGASASASASDIWSMTLGSSQRSSSRNENFMALLQKKGSKASSGGARVSAMELLKSTNPLARRVTEFSSSSSPTSADGGPADGAAQEAATGDGQ